MQHLTDYINRNGALDAASMTHLRSLVERYPYYHAARILLLKALHAAHDPQFSSELRITAINVPSRETLYDMIEGDSLRPQKQQRHLSKAAQERGGDEGDRTGSLIDTFLSNAPEEKPKRKPRATDATTDYLGYLMQTEWAGQDMTTSAFGNENDSHGQSIIDNFIGQQRTGRLVLEDKDDKDLQKPNLEQGTESSEGVFTETLARIYIQQGKYDKAIDIIRRLSLNYPKKNRYFADQIRFLNKLIINNKNK